MQQKEHREKNTNGWGFTEMLETIKYTNKCMRILEGKEREKQAEKMQDKGENYPNVMKSLIFTSQNHNNLHAKIMHR